MEAIPFWKKIHQTVSGYSTNVSNRIAGEILTLSKTTLLEGLLYYKPFSKKRYDEWIEESSPESDLKEFMYELCQDLNLDATLAYPIMCNYLMFEYYGKIKEFWQITRIGTTAHLKESIWTFYTSERMFLLKTWRHIFEFAKKNEDFSEEYAEFLQSLNLEELQENLVKQFKMLMTEIDSKTSSSEKNARFENLVCRNIREQIETLLIIILTTEHRLLTINQTTELLKMFVQNNFGSQSLLSESRQSAKSEDLEELMYTQITCFFVLINNYWYPDNSGFWQQESIKEIDSSLITLGLNPGHTMVTLSWLLLKYKSLKDETVPMQIGDLFIHKPFVSLYYIISNSMFKNCTAGEVVMKSVHRMLDELSLLFDDRKQLYGEEGMNRVLGELLKCSDVADLCLKTRNGLDVMVDIAIQTFPVDFYSLTIISRSLLAQPEHSKNTLQLLNQLPAFLSEMPWTTPTEQISVLRKSQRAFSESDLIVFPAKTVVKAYAIFNDVYVQYRGPYSYFNYLEHLVNSVIAVGRTRGQFNGDMLKKILAGYDVVIAAIKCSADMDLKQAGLESILQKLSKVLIHLDGPLFNFDLIKLYLNVQNALLVYRDASVLEISPEIIFPKLKSEYADKDPRTLLFHQYIFEKTIFTRMFHEEEFKQDHDLLLAYIDILSNVIKTKVQFKNVQLSSIIYLLNFVFLQHQTWAYRDDNQKTLITLGCVTIFHNILQMNVADLSQNEQQIFKLCQDAFLENSHIIETFLRLFIKHKYYLIFAMERESNWLHGESLNKLKCIRMQLALLLVLMNEKKAFERCYLDDKLTLIVKPVASYFTNSYSPVIAELSCRFLEKLAQIPDFPLLALLELDHYQVQSLFLERLRDPLEEEIVKTAIISLINTCITNQNGMTAAFFNLKCFMYWDGAENNVFSGDSVSEFMVDYLQNVKRSHEYFKNPLQLGILRVLCNLWQNHRENLIDNIANMKDFWPVMIAPFFRDWVQEVEVYTFILKIINFEIGSEPDKVEPALIKTIDDFFKNERLKSWIDFVLASIRNGGKRELLCAWIEFVVLTKKVTPDSFGDDVKILLVESCLDGLNCPEAGFRNIEIVYLWTKLYLIVASSWPVYKKQDEKLVEKLTTFLHSVGTYYKYLPTKIKEIVLCVVHKTIVDLQYYLEGAPSAFQGFLRNVGAIIDMEYEFLNSEVWHIKDENAKIQRLKPWLLIIFIGNSILRVYNVEDIALWFSYRQLLERIMDSVGRMLQDRCTLPFVKIAMDFIITYTESPLAKDLLSIDLFGFFYKINTPSITISVGEAILSGVPVNLKEWWLILILLIKLIRSLMENVGNSEMLNACFMFITQHDDLIQEMICLIKFTVDMTALTLVCETLKLIYEVLCIIPHWSAQYPRSYAVIMEGITTTINACVLSVLGYKKINFYNIINGKKLDVIDDAPVDLLVSVLNKLIEIIYWSSICLKKTKPDLVTQLNEQYPQESMTLLIRNDFSVPRFELPIRSTLTYGTLLCLADYLCKTLNQLSPDTPSATPRSREVSMTDLHTDIKVKSLSKIFEYCTATYEKCIGFMVYLQRSEDVPNDKLSSFLHFDMSEFSGSATSVTSHLDYRMVKNSLEALMSFLTAEIFITVRYMNESLLFSFKRELSSEIQFFYEFVRKRTSEQYNSMLSIPRSLTSLMQSETDIVKRYMVAKVNDDDIVDVADQNFVLVIAQWLINFCSLSN